MVDRLANGDITKHDEIYKRNYIECLNLLSYWHERDLFYKSMEKPITTGRQINYNR